MKRFGTDPVPLSRRGAFAIAVVVAIAAGVIAAHAGQGEPRPDIDQLWYAARAMTDGRNPYDVVGPGRAFDYRWQLFYPLPAVVLVTPLSLVSLPMARVLMAAIGGGVLAYAVARADARGLVLFLSRAFYVNAWYAQWTPLLLAMWFIPALSALVAAKPTMGLVMLPGVKDWRRAKWGLLLAVVLVLLSVALRPSWPSDWMAAMGSNTHIRPWITVPGGAVLLVALVRWRRWEARLLAAFALVPQTFHPLATLPLVLLPGTLGGKATVAALTYLPNALLVRKPFGPRLTGATPEDVFAMLGTIILWTVLVPTLLLVLRLPNEGPAPAWMERVAARWPAWLRGRPS